jgi:nitroreductase
VEVLGAASVVGDVDVGEPIAERLEQRCGAVPSLETTPEVGVADIEVEAEVGERIEHRGEIVDIGELPVEVLHHQPDPPAGGILGELCDRLGVAGPNLLDRVQRDPLIGVHVDEFDTGIGEAVEAPAVEIPGLFLEFREAGGDREVVGGVPHGVQTEVVKQAADFLAVGQPRGRGFEREIEEVEAVLVHAVDLLDDRAAGEIHRSDKHADHHSISGGRLDPLAYPGVMETYDAIMTRRSVGKTTGERPDRETIQKLIRAAVAAPNHHLTEPWRFLVLTGSALEEFGEAWATGAEREGKDPAGLKDKALRAPVIIAVIEKPKGHLPKVIEVEEHHAVGAAMQNMLLAAHEMGLAAMLRTGPAAHIKECHDFIGLGDDELVAGYVYVGYPPEGFTKGPPRKTPAEELTEWRGWDD